MPALRRCFYSRDPLTVARELLGKQLVREYQGQLLRGLIVEVEAYFGSEDSGSHAVRGRTPRNAPMFGEPGHAYVYLIYGMYQMLNVVTSPREEAGAVLIRALRPLAGQETMEQLRGRRQHLVNGPGKLCRALDIHAGLNGWDLTEGQQLWIEPCEQFSPAQIRSGPRIGIGYALPEHRDAPWRLWVEPASEPS